MSGEYAFATELERSVEVVQRIAAWLSTRGVPVVIRPTFLAPSFAERAGYADDGDLEVLQRVEVKRQRRTFTGPDDYPFPDCIVDAVKNHDAKRPRPHSYFIVNESMTAALFVDVWRTREHWAIRRLVDSRHGVAHDYYLCPVELLMGVTL